MFKSIFLKYFMATAVTVVICFTFLGTALLVMTANYSVEEKQNQLLHNAQNLSVLTANMLKTPFALYEDNENAEAVREFRYYKYIISSFNESGTKDILIVSAYENDCLWFTSSNDVVYGNSMVDDYIIDIITNNGIYKSAGTMNGLFSENRYTVGVPIIVDKTLDDGEASSLVLGYLFVSSPAESLTSLLSVVSRFYFVSVCGVLILSFLLVYVGTKSLTRPITDMKNALSKFAHGDFSKRVRVKGDDEITELCVSFNNMADSLEQLEISRRGFMANISHDLKTPMTTISGFIDGILDGTIEPDRQKQYLQRVSDEMKRLSRLVYSILDITRLEGGQVKIESTSFDINEIIKRVLLSFEIVIEEKEIKLDFDLDEKIYVWADEDSIYRVLTNIIGNAVKYTDQKGRISVRTSSEGGRNAVIRIRNTGPGIANDEIPFIFDRFYKSDKSRGLDKESMGLGLYIAKMLVNLNNGEIGVESMQNSYTEFYFTLELHREGRSDRAEKADKPDRQK